MRVILAMRNTKNEMLGTRHDFRNVLFRVFAIVLFSQAKILTATLLGVHLTCPSSGFIERIPSHMGGVSVP